MSGSDRYILEFLWNDGNELVATPRIISANIDYKHNTVRTRVGTLRRVGLLEYFDKDDGIYQLTDLGRRLLNDELTDEELEELESSYDRLKSDG